MGRTNPTFRDVLRAVENQWQPYRRALRHEDQERFDRLLTHARTHADAAGNLNHQSPIVPVLLSIALAQERRIDELEARHTRDDPDTRCAHDESDARRTRDEPEARCAHEEQESRRPQQAETDDRTGESTPSGTR